MKFLIIKIFKYGLIVIHHIYWVYSKGEGMIFNDLDGIKNNFEWFKKQEKYLNSLTKEEKDLIISYSQMDFLYFNDARNSKEYDVLELNKIIKKSPILENDLIVWRGTSKYIKKNDVYQYQGFVSTSILLRAPLKFMDEKCCLVKILLKKGTKCLFLQPLLSEKNRDEMEILLPRNTRLKIKKINIHIINDTFDNDIDRIPFDRQIIQTQTMNKKWFGIF